MPGIGLLPGAELPAAIGGSLGGFADAAAAPCDSGPIFGNDHRGGATTGATTASTTPPR